MRLLTSTPCTAKASPFRRPSARPWYSRFPVDSLWSRISSRLERLHSSEASATLLAEGLSYVFFFLLVGATFFL